MGTLDVHAIVDNARFGRFHWMVMLWCALLLIFDGYDLFIYGVVLDGDHAGVGVDATTGRGAGSYALFGMMFGALVFGSFAVSTTRRAFTAALPAQA